MLSITESYQARFERAWGHLANGHARALAWLLDSPNLLDAASPHWEGKIASFAPAARAWLDALDQDSSALDAALGGKVYTRLGLYAEKLMAFYFEQHRMLVAHGLQVRAARNDTVGEFDFLLDAGAGQAEHWELATKFYLLEGSAPDRFDALLGPNLADSLGAKMRKITGKQLELASHPAAQAVLPRPVVRARALVKGWLFYPKGTFVGMEGIDPGHCRGFWCAQQEVAALPGDAFVILPRMLWLAPVKTPETHRLLSRAALAAVLEGAPMPVLVAAVCEENGYLVEQERGFIVPDDWRARAAARLGS
ncbi:MAG: DUF1853 family protein [Pseudomonadota bacterium]